MKITKTKSYKAAFTGIAAAVAITLSFLEGLIPTAAFMPPGAKAGFSNIAVMFAASEFGLIPALSVTLLKSLFVLRAVPRHFLCHSQAECSAPL